MNESMVSNSRMSMSMSGTARPSIAERAKSIIGGGPKLGQLFPGGKIPFAPFMGNRNLLTFSQKLASAGFSQQPYQTDTPRRSQHQLLLAAVYNKLILFHLIPDTVEGAEIQIYEIDPSFNYRNTQPITVKTFSSQSQLL